MITATDFHQAVGKRLRQLRLAMDKSQDDVGEKLGVRGTAVSMYESGERALDPYHALKLKVAYGAPLEWLYGADESVIPPSLAERLKKATTAKRRPKKPPAKSSGRSPKIARTAEMA